MAFRTQKISQMTPKGSDLEATDLIEVSTIESGSYVTRSITGQELIDAIPVPPSGITIGTTAIASGTVGRVLFQGTGNVVQQSSSLFWDATNNRLGIGTSTPTQTLDIVGSLNSTSSLNGDLDNLIIRNTLNGASSQTRLRFYNELTPSVTTGGAIFYTSNAYSGFPANSFGFWNYNTNGVIAFATSVERMRIASTGNVLIGTTTDAGFRLDVNGTARVRASDGISAFQITAPTRAWYFTTSQQGGTFNAISGAANGAAGTGNFGFVINGGWAFSIGLSTSQPNSFFSVYPSATNNGEVRIGGQTGNASSLLTLESTTKGFLPPRMTTTQKNAIATPAAGLVVYDTTLNKLCVYTTAWETVTSL